MRVVLIMSVFGGMSEGERNRIKIRVRAAMASQAKIEGRYVIRSSMIAMPRAITAWQPASPARRPIP